MLQLANSKGRRFKENGDTIVEVLIVLAVLGLALSISYATANRSLLNLRQAEENAQATRYAQSEVESLYTEASTDTPGTGIFIRYAPFCMPGNTIKDQNSPDCQITPNLKVVIYNCNLYTGDPCTRHLVERGTDTYIVQAMWTDIVNGQQDFVTQSYRVHPGVL